MDRVAAGGKVIAEESGEYGALSITKAVTVEAAAGVKALIATASGTGIDIHAGDTDTVTVKGLTLVSQRSLPAWTRASTSSGATRCASRGASSTDTRSASGRSRRRPPSCP